MELKNFQHFSKVDWNGGIYATLMMGSKSGALIATTWAAMMYHGKTNILKLQKKYKK